MKNSIIVMNYNHTAYRPIKPTDRIKYQKMLTQEFLGMFFNKEKLASLYHKDTVPVIQQKAKVLSCAGAGKFGYDLLKEFFSNIFF